MQAYRTRTGYAALVLGAVLAFAAADANNGLKAQNEAAWCAADPDAVSCGYYTYQQCMAAISGIGGYCHRNPKFGWGAPHVYGAPSDYAPARRTERKPARQRDRGTYYAR
jgi:hypothetical protein